MILRRTRGALFAVTSLLYVAIAMAQSLPQGNVGIASHFPGDGGIASDPAVIFADDFESYSSASGLTVSGKWNNYYQAGNTKIATANGGFYAGAKALEFTLPQTMSPIQPSLDFQCCSFRHDHFGLS